VADNLYWLGRYAERAEGLTRLLRGILRRLIETSGLAEAPELPVLLQVVSRLSEDYPGFVGAGAQARLAEPETELLAILNDPCRRDGRASLLNALLRVAGTVRDRISTDMWRVLWDLGESRQRQGQFPPSSRSPAETDTTVNGRHRTLSDELELLDRTV